MQTLFDENGFLNFSGIVENHPAFKAIMADGIVTEDEIKQQGDATVASLKKVQELCNKEQQNAVLEAISNISVLFAAYQNYQLQNILE